jgi:hypothetical protein
LVFSIDRLVFSKGSFGAFCAVVAAHADSVSASIAAQSTRTTVISLNSLTNAQRPGSADHEISTRSRFHQIRDSHVPKRINIRKFHYTGPKRTFHSDLTKAALFG